MPNADESLTMMAKTLIKMAMSTLTPLEIRGVINRAMADGRADPLDLEVKRLLDSGDYDMNEEPPHKR